MRARDILCAEYGNGKNFMTPTVLEIGSIWRGRVAYELSRGEGLIRRGSGIYPPPSIYGVTIASYDPDMDTTRRYMNDISGCFGSLDAAKHHVNFLRENWWQGETDLLAAIARHKAIGG